MNRVTQTIKNFFSGFRSKQLLPSVIIRSGLPTLYRSKVDWQKPKGFFKRFADQLKNLFKG